MRHSADHLTVDPELRPIGLRACLADSAVHSPEEVHRLIEDFAAGMADRHYSTAEILAARHALGVVLAAGASAAPADAMLSAVPLPVVGGSEWGPEDAETETVDSPSDQNGRPAGTAPDLALPAAGDRRYEAQRLHARGGLGEVYVAHDRELHREVALKRIQQRHAANPISRLRFLFEAEITGRLEHPGVVPVYGLVQGADGQPCYAMRFIQGETLEAAVRRFHEDDPAGRCGGERSLALRQLLSRFLAVCATVAYAHSRGILHCDLKPANIMLGRYGETLVVDWGMAKTFDRTGVKGAEHEDTLRPSTASGEPLPEAGVPRGTPAYMSPEQAAGRWEQVGTASDVYSLGATLYTLLTGRPPCQGRDAWETLAQVVQGEILRPGLVKRDVPPALEAICRKAMAFRPGDRYASPLALADDLERWLAGQPVAAYRPAWRERLGARVRAWCPVASAGVLALLTAAAAVAYRLL